MPHAGVQVPRPLYPARAPPPTALPAWFRRAALRGVLRDGLRLCAHSRGRAGASRIRLTDSVGRHTERVASRCSRGLPGVNAPARCCDRASPARRRRGWHLAAPARRAQAGHRSRPTRTRCSSLRASMLQRWGHEAMTRTTGISPGGRASVAGHAVSAGTTEHQRAVAGIGTTARPRRRGPSLGPSRPSSAVALPCSCSQETNVPG